MRATGVATDLPDCLCGARTLGQLVLAIAQLDLWQPNNGRHHHVEIALLWKKFEVKASIGMVPKGQQIAFNQNTKKRCSKTALLE
jgi:hypothetical protein